LKILVIGEVFYPEDFIINDLINQWEKDGYQLEVLTRTPSYPYGKPYKGYKNWLYQKTRFGSVKVHRIPIVRGYNKNLFLKILNYLGFVFFCSIVALFIGRRFDKVFIYQTGPLTLALPAILIKKLYKKKVIIWSQDLWPDTVYAYGFKQKKILAVFLNWLVKIVYKNCEYIFVSCPGFIDKIKKYSEISKISVAPNWPLINASQNNNINAKHSESINFIFTGNIGKVQNLENVIEGFYLASAVLNNIILNIFGDGSNIEELKKLVNSKKINNIVFHGRKPLSEMPAIMASSDVLILSLIDSPIYELTIPSKFQTYLTAGKPIFGVIKGDAKKIIEENSLGFTAPPSNIESISEGFVKFVKLSDLEIKQMAINATLLLNRNFNRDSIIDQITKKVFNH
jgi:glycosyltransferase involved in cell wall biosynthesis